MPKMSRWQTNEIPTLLNIASETGCVNIERYKEQCQICMFLGSPVVAEKKALQGTTEPGLQSPWERGDLGGHIMVPWMVPCIEDPGRRRWVQKLCVVRSWKFAVQNCGA